ncbi:glycoside hydrolase family 3 protein [Erwinia sp. V71]|uniref:glycoside hydrolase family 3 protein n=1 Tax=Erwinia sp. V71 TaxID=3369424 RepID=UPI003F5F509A
MITTKSNNKLTLLAGAIITSLFSPLVSANITQPDLGVKNKPLLHIGSLTFKDLNQDGRLNPYEDWRLTPQQRAQDLVKRMTRAEKAGLMMHGSAPSPGSVIGAGSVYDLPAAQKMIVQEQVRSLITRLSGRNPQQMAEENNKLQQIAESSRLGIPLTISSDPRNSFEYLTGASVDAGLFSKWPETLGIAAVGDESLARQYGDIIRQEYRAVGINEALSPQADIATEPRWARINGTFGEDAELTKRMVRGYITGIQKGTSGVGNDSVAAIVKHWVGYGAAKDGWDSHNAYGKYAAFSGDHLERHIYPFTGAFEAGVAGVMPTYSILQGASWQGKAIEPVAAGFNHFLLTGLLRGQYHFNGIILSDWLITSDCNQVCEQGAPAGEKPVPEGMPWGMENATVQQRFVKAVQAGVDQFGGVTDSAVIVAAVQQGEIAQARIDASVEKLLTQTFALGLFEQPYVDAARAAQVVGNPAAQQAADEAQARSLVLLQNQGVLPLRQGMKIWLSGVDKQAAQQAGLVVVDEPQQADIALVRTSAPFEQPHRNYFFGSRHHEGSLAFKDDNADYQKIQQVSRVVPTIVTVYLDRPAILTNVQTLSKGLIANFGVSDTVLLQKMLSLEAWRGRLPFELPSSMDAVLKQQSDVAADSEKPLYPLGFGLAR